MAAPRPLKEPAVLLEALEPRIAPAVIAIGPSELSGVPTGAKVYAEPDPADGVFKSADKANADVFPVASSTDHFYLDLKSGDTVRMVSKASSPVDFIKVSAGRAYAFFFDANNDNIPESNELTGMVASSGSKITVFGDLNGSFLANLDGKTGDFSDDSLVTGSGKTASIASLKVTGNIGQEVSGGGLQFGNVLAGGSISNVTAGRLNSLQSGTPSASLPDSLEPISFHLGGSGQTAGQGTIGLFQPAAKTGGGSLSNITLNSADSILAGPGFAGGAGGNISGLKIIADSDGITVRGGAGGDNTSAGGAGGGVSQVVFSGVAGSSSDLVGIFGGKGGDSVSAAGGAGGSVAKVWVGYQYDSSQKLIISPDLLVNEVLVAGGEGGGGTKGGAGGSLKSVNVVAAPQENGLVDAEIRLFGGDGGLLNAQGVAAGAGGGVSSFKIQNLDADSGDISAVLVKGGDASSASAVLAGVKTSGAAGGSIANPVAKSNEAWLVAQSISFEGGSGSFTAGAGGKGGSISNLYFGLYANQLLEDFTAIGGAGGDSSLGSGGAGGSISGVYVPIAELSKLEFSGGAGGQGLSGNGGAGGSVGSAQIFDINPALLPALVLAGDGGLGSKSGGAGGSISNFSYFGDAAALRAEGGQGGNGQSRGGAGGTLKGVAFSSRALLPGTTAELLAGNGGSALSPSGGGAGGKGGSVSGANVQTVLDVSLRAGTGGSSSGTGAPGAGGMIGNASASLGVFARSEDGSVSFNAGDAGVTAPTPGGAPKAGAAGGAIINAVGSADKNLSFVSGNGAAGGAGGSVSRIGFYGAGGASTLFAGDLAVRAGDGGDPLSPSSAGGAGGSISTALGTVSGNAAASVVFEAGSGGGNRDLALVGTKGGQGGSVKGVKIFDGVSSFSVVAGDGGDGNVAGGAGGSVQQVASSFAPLAPTLTDEGSFYAPLGPYSVNDATASDSSAAPLPSGLTGDINFSRDVKHTRVGGASGYPAWNGGGVWGGPPNLYNGDVYETEGPILTLDLTPKPGESAIGSIVFYVLGTSAGDDFTITVPGGENIVLTNVQFATAVKVSTTDLTETALSTIRITNNSGNAFGVGQFSAAEAASPAPAPSIKAVAAGDGGDAVSGRGKGGAGGSVSNVDVARDLGLRSGAAYGFATDGSKAGGLFVGVGGTNISSPADVSLQGKNGNVSNITAEAISCIVAGRGASPLLAGTVNGIFLRGNTAVQAGSDGAFVNFSEANLVGSKLDPLLAGASSFHYSAGDPSAPTDTAEYPWIYGSTLPVDGLIAAAKLTDKRNFLPLAFLTNTAAAKQTPVYELFLPVPQSV